MNPIKHNSNFIKVPFTIDQAEQAVYAIEQCQQALIRALKQNGIPLTTRKQSEEVLASYEGAIVSLRETLIEAGAPADPLPQNNDDNKVYHEMYADQPFWRRAILSCVKDKQLEDEDGKILASGKQLGNVFYEQEKSC